MADDIVLSLDIAGRTGWSVNSSIPGVPVIGHWDGPTPLKAEAGGVDYGQTFSSFNRFLRFKIEQVKPTLLVYEAPLPVVGPNTKAAQFKTTSHTIRYLNGLVAFAEAAAHDANIDCFEKSPQDVKFYFVGSRNATKEAMIARCRQLRWGVQNDDEADSAALWALAMSILDPKFSIAAMPLFERGR